MVTHLEEVNKIPESDLCIIGAGAAGLELAHALRHSKLTITILEAGFEEFDWQAQTFGAIEQVGKKIRSPDYSNPFSFETAKKYQPYLHQLGGTLNIWSGKWKIFDPIDFERGWPLTFEELFPYYKSVAEDFHLTDLLRLYERSLKFPPFIAGAPGFIPSYHLKENHPTNLAVKYGEFIASERVRILVGAPVVKLIFSEDRHSVKQLRLRNRSGKEWAVKAKRVVLTAGTFENTRALLVSGLQNSHLGHYLMDHPKDKRGIFTLLESLPDFPEAHTSQYGSHLFAIGLSLHPDILREKNIPNHCLYFHPLSRGKYKVNFFIEQLSNYESRLFLSDQVDAFGVPKLVADWRFSAKDQEGFRRFIDCFNEKQIGKISLDESDYSMEFLGDASHQMGTTRMAKVAGEGVVDRNLRTFGVDNLFVLGSSVFPTAGNANPTFTILALARRLAEYLARDSQE